MGVKILSSSLSWADGDMVPYKHKRSYGSDSLLIILVWIVNVPVLMELISKGSQLR